LAPSSPGAPATRRISRDDIVALAKQGRPWDFIPLALRVLKQLPDDHGMRLMAASNYARLGLRTAALEHLDLLPGPLQAEQSVRDLRQALAAFRDDEIPIAARAATCEANKSALRERGADLAAAHENWLERTSRERWFITRDNNITRRAAGAAADDPWLHFRNDRAEADSFPFPHLATPDKSAKPYVLEGLSPPWMLQRLFERTPDAPDGYRTRISVVQESETEALDGLSCTDLRSILRDPRVELFIGAGSGDRYATAMRDRLPLRAGGPAIVLATTRTRARPLVADTLQRFASDQHQEHQRLLADIEALYAQRDRAWWRRRFAAPAEPLRVLVPTCRYSTFVKHSAADLADAFRAAGWESRVLVEPDDSSHLASVAYLRQIAEFHPDLVVLINYTRTSIGNFLPPTIPFVCWLQDAMPHQFDAKLAAQQGPLDFLVGYLHREMFEEFGFTRDRAAVFPVAVSPRKFHAGPVAADVRARLECDVAYVSHHSETPEAMHTRLVNEASAKEPLAGRIFEELRPAVAEIALNPMERIAATELRIAAHAAARRVLGAEPPPGTVTLVTRQYCYPLADRLIRHQTLAWAARIAHRRGWSLRIHGRGWDRHPTLAPFARPELAHDEELRASYQCAGVHLHASSNWLLHQRVMECALSGGLPLTRLKKSDLIQWEQSVLHTLAHEAPIVMERQNALRYREYGYAVADHPAALAYAAQLQRLGVPAAWDLWIHGKRFDEFRATPRDAAEPPAGSFLADLSLTTFKNEQELETLIERALADRDWRASASRLISGRVRTSYTTDALVGVLAALIRKSLA
jgi:hypothetical protein